MPSAADHVARAIEANGGAIRFDAFMQSALECLRDDHSNYVCVETGEFQRSSHPDGVTSLACLPDGDLRGVVLANELLDNLAFRLLVFDGSWREAWVSSNGDSFTEVLRPMDSTPGFVLPERATHGARVP
ncbi:MAG: hypothetical protein EB010_06305, partial [Acidimicrobiia bacterium]|nr:hypothetical protein [Acidimicrobiia bacterium]